MPEPREIFTTIGARPPHLREQAKTAYLGKEVDWLLTFVDGWEERGESARLAFRQERGGVRFVVTRLALADPWLWLLRSGEPVRVHGRIADIGAQSIELSDARVTQLVGAAS